MTALIAFAGTLLLRATVLLAGALLASELLDRSSAAARHAFWSVTAVALLLLPWLPSALPRLALPLPAALVARGVDAATADRLPAPAPTVAPTDSPAAQLAPSSPTIVPPAVPDSPRVARGSLPTNLPSFGALLAIWLWAVGSLAAIGSLLLALRRVARVARFATPLADRSWQRILLRARVRVGLRRPVQLRSTPAASTALAGGVVRAYVLMPPSADAWSTERRELVLLHELVHVARHDALRQIVSRLAVALYWFHPLARLAARKALLAREEACDEAVIALGLKPSVYARHLLDLAEPGELMLPALSLTERPQLEKRVMSILRDRPRSGRRATVASAACACLWALTVAATAPVPSSQQVPPTPAPPQVAPLPSRAPVVVAPSAPSAPAVRVQPSVVPGGGRSVPVAPLPAVAPQAPTAQRPSVVQVPSATPTPSVAPAPTALPSRESPLAPPAPAAPSVRPGTPRAFSPSAAPSLAPAPGSPAPPAVPAAAFPWAVATPSALAPTPAPVAQERSCWEVAAGERAEGGTIRYSRPGGSGEIQRYVLAGGDRMIRSNTGDMTVCMRTHGTVSFADDGTRIGSLGEGSWVVIGSRDAQRTVEMVVTQGASGLSYLWYVNGTLRPMGSEGTEWRDAVLPVVSEYWQMAEVDVARAALAERAARAAAEQAIRDESIARRVQLDQLVAAQRELEVNQERLRREVVARSDTTLASLFDAELRRLRMSYEVTAQGSGASRPQMDSLNAAIESLHAELERVAETAAAQRAVSVADLLRAREALQLNEAGRAERERAMQERLETVRASAQDAAAIQRTVRDVELRLQDQTRRLQEAMRRIP